MSKGDEYGTPYDFYNFLNERFQFDLDPCTTEDNPLGTSSFSTKEDDGLSKPWHHYSSRVFMNPPYSKVGPWVKKAYAESLCGCMVVGLVRHDTSTKWWNDWVKGKAHVWPIPYRLKHRGATGAYNFPQALVIWHGMEAFKPCGKR